MDEEVFTDVVLDDEEEELKEEDCEDLTILDEDIVTSSSWFLMHTISCRNAEENVVENVVAVCS